jgi:Ca2+-binding EF-hand superfamily protein
MSSTLERGRRRAAERQSLAQHVFAQHLAKTMDVEQLLVEKLAQKTKGGRAGILAQFKKLDSCGEERSVIRLADFRRSLERFGLQGINEEDAKAVFDRYDTDGSGEISFKEFGANVAAQVNEESRIGRSSSDIQDANRVRERARVLKQQALRTGWKTLSVDAERMLLEKIEQRLKGGGNSLRVAFQRFERGGSPEISLEQFSETLCQLGLQGLDREDAQQLFGLFDRDGNGTIDFDEFTRYVMKRSSTDNSLTLDTTSAQREAARLRARALEKQKLGTELHWRYAEKNVDLEQLFMDKVLQKLKGGQDALRRTFCLFDSSRGDAAAITPASFRAGCEALGLNDVPERVLDELFSRFDESRNGVIEFAEFARRISRNYSPLDSRPAQHHPIKHRHACKHARHSCAKCGKARPARSHPPPPGEADSALPHIHIATSR